MKKLNCSSFIHLAVVVAVSPLAFACSAMTPSTGSGPTGSDSGSMGTTDSGTTGATGGEDGATGADDAGQDVGDAAPLPVVTNYVSGVTVSTLAGSSLAGSQDGTGAAAQFDNPTGMAVDASGNLLTCDYDDGRVRLVTPAGVVTTIAEEAAHFVDPFATVVASDGRYYVETDANSSGVKNTTTGTIWLVTPVGGSIATPTVVAPNLDRPRSLAPMPGGNLFVMDRTLNVAETLDVATGQVTVIAGSSGASGDIDATGSVRPLQLPVRRCGDARRQLSRHRRREQRRPAGHRHGSRHDVCRQRIADAR